MQNARLPQAGFNRWIVYHIRPIWTRGSCPPQQLRSIQGWNAQPAHLAYRVGQGPHLFRAGGSVPLRGGVMVVDGQGYDGTGPIGPFCQEVVSECSVRGFSGAVLDFDRRLPPLEQLAGQLDRLFAQRGLQLYVPETFGHCVAHGRVILSSALSGGSLAQRLEEAAERFGRDRIALSLERSAEDFSLPSPTGSGAPLTRQQLRQQMDTLRPAVFFSRELCARYYTYMNRDTGAHFVLFDDGDTMLRKVEVARQAGVSVFLAPYEDIRDCAGPLGLLPHPAQKRGPRAVDAVSAGEYNKPC